MPRDPHSEDALHEVLARQFPSLNQDALDRIKSGRSLYASRHKLREGLSPDYARLVLLRAMGVFAKISRLPASRFHLSEEEQELLHPVIDPERPASRRS